MPHAPDRPSGSAPDRGRILAWLASPAVVDDGGGVASWANPRHPGFPYPEAAGIWLAWAAWRRRRGEPGPDDATAARVAGRLAVDLSGGRGVGKAGHAYLFDTCVALHGLVLAGASGAVPMPSPGTCRDGLQAVAGFLDRDVPVDPPAEPGRWSGTFGPFQARAAGLLEAAGRAIDLPGAAWLASRLRERIRPEDPRGGPRYVHAWCYALEGEALRGDVRTLAEAAPRLAALQREDGGMPAWDDGEGASRSDATAQAVRLWAAAPGEDGGAMARGLVFLARQQVPAGGLRYEAGSDDLPTWAACFADQAAAWAGAAPDGWV